MNGKSIKELQDKFDKIEDKEIKLAIQKKIKQVNKIVKK